MVTDDKSITALQNRNNAAYNLLYTFYYPGIEKFVKQNSGTPADAEDVFQETIMVLLEKVPKKDFVLTSSIKTYITAIAHNIWLKRLRDAKQITRLELNYELEDMTLAEWEQHEEKITQRNLLQRIFDKLTRHCVVFLTKTFLSGASREQLMEEMGYKNAHTFDNQKYKCLEQARKNNIAKIG
ncbi:sigma-70 family RNA polymerase sigma factor [Chryseotalea sanaruensis]|uniref:Sigma-70 family RNA polymerase sigma factor n=1 Tax=Chryseotalea sanaruensis TaxID=2482724 RepID=A0A401U8T7_9BACT|nr:sigma-70 family RNA polymerase sigma factor [Chryseotalea sanaruensis]GCC51306.1 sigma-70 family RNA polymerase sigma factor [Chryseotalea sanaruensis]